MIAVIIAHRKKLLISVGLLCLSYPAFGMERNEEIEEKKFQWSQRKKRNQQDNQAEAPSLQKQRLSRHYSQTSMFLYSPADALLAPSNICGTRVPLKRSSSNSLLIQQESRSPPISEKITPITAKGDISGSQQSKSIKISFDEKIKRSFDKMQIDLTANSITYIQWLRYTFYKEAGKDTDKNRLIKVTGKSIEETKPEKILNKFWGFDVLSLLSNSDHLKEMRIDTLELLGASIKFLCNNVRSKENNKSALEENCAKIVSKTLSLSKIDFIPAKNVSKKPNKSQVKNEYIQKLGESAIICYGELSSRCSFLYKKCPQDEYLYKAAKYLSCIGEFEESYYEKAWLYLNKCTLFLDYIDEDYTNELRWIKFLKLNKLNALMQYLTQPSCNADYATLAKDYLAIARMEEKIIEIENSNSESFSEETEETEKNRFISYYLESLKYYYLEDPKTCFFQMSFLSPRILKYVGFQAKFLTEIETQYQKVFLNISNIAYELLFETYIINADQGDIEAEYELGLMYENGYGTQKNEEEALKCYQNAADENHVKAKEKCEKMYQESRGVPKDPLEAFEYYKTAVLNDNTEAQFQLGYIFENGLGIEQNGKEAAKYYKLAASKAHPLSQHLLATMYEEGFGVEKSPEMAFFWHKEAAKNGNLSSQDMLGWMHENGCGTPQDKEEAFRCYEIAANRGEKHSQMSLVLMYEMGEGVQKNPEKAATWCRKLAEAEDPAAQFKLSVFFKDGFGVPVNKREAFKWCERSANKGGQNAIALLRWMYFSGYVVAPSDENEAILFHKKALHIYRRAAEDGDERGILKLASMFAKGEGIGKNIGKAIELYENSAVKKNPDVCVALGTLYTEIKDEENANKWFQEASNNK